MFPIFQDGKQTYDRGVGLVANRPPEAVDDQKVFEAYLLL